MIIKGTLLTISIGLGLSAPTLACQYSKGKIRTAKAEKTPLYLDLQQESNKKQQEQAVTEYKGIKPEAPKSKEENKDSKET